MKTIEKDTLVSKSLIEVWRWKEAVYEDIRNKTFKEKQKYYKEGLKEAVKLLNGRLKRNPDGSFCIVE